MEHPDTILDAIEIYYPFLAIATGCIDGKIRVISLVNKIIQAEVSIGHITGIRQLDFTPFHGAYMISVGFEVYFNVWSLQSSLTFGKTGKDIPM